MQQKQNKECFMAVLTAYGYVVPGAAFVPHKTQPNHPHLAPSVVEVWKEDASEFSIVHGSINNDPPITITTAVFERIRTFFASLTE